MEEISKQIDEDLKQILKVVQWYQSHGPNSSPDPNLLLRGMARVSCILIKMAGYRSEVKKQWTAIKMREIRQESSVSKAESIADQETFELLYVLRQHMDFASQLVDVMRTELSFIKFEINNS